MLNLIETQLQKSTWKRFTNYFEGIAQITKIILTFLLILVIPLGIALSDDFIFDTLLTLFSIVKLPWELATWLILVLGFLALDLAIFIFYFVTFIIYLPLVILAGASLRAIRKITKDEVFIGFIVIIWFGMLIGGIILLIISATDPSYIIYGLILVIVSGVSFIIAIVNGWEGFSF